jgi:subtilisin family serine protease
MARLDPGLERMLRAMRDPSSDTRGDEVVGLSVKYTGDVESLRKCGMVVMGDAGGIAIGDIRLDQLEALAALDNVEAIHAPSRVHAHLDTSVPEIHADVVRTGVPGYTGAGIIIGIVDTGIDILHNNFRKADNVTTRILALWDQTLIAAAGENAPAGFGTLGVEFTPAQINAAIQAKNESFRHQDVNGHGSHVAGIAAGNGSQSGNCHTAFFYRGVAPEADLVIVKALPDPNSVNKATDIQKAVQYIFNQATTAGKPCVVNMSLGHATGSHDGADPEDIFFDGLLSPAAGPVAGRVIVVSAGNDGSLGTIDDISTGWYKHGNHTSGHIAVNGTSQPLQFMVPPNDKTADFIDLRYSSAGQLQFTVTEPGGISVGPIAYNAGAGTATPLAGNTVTIDAITLARRNQFFLTISPPAGGAITSGQWSITLREASGNPVDYDIWIATSHQDPYPVFVYGQRVQARTITGPGTAKNVITVASYGSETGVLADSSSRGPTLAADNRQKPEIAAPGLESGPASGIVAPKSKARGVFYCCDCCMDFYVGMQGTSMAAPHVTGVVALMLQKDPTLTFDKIKTALQTSSRDPGGGVARPNNDWGYGKIDAQQAMTNVAAPAGGGGGGGGGSIALESIELPVPTPLGKFKLAPSSPSSAELVEGSKEKTPAINSYFAPGALPIARKLNEIIVRNRDNPAAQLLAALVSIHIDEVYRLIHSNRRVATMWHRMNGPTMMRSVIIGSDPRANGHPVVPDRLSGKQLSEPLGRLLNLLQRYGSKGLRDDVSSYEPLMLALPGSTLSALRDHNFITFEKKTAVDDGFATGNP